ncbi:MAG: (Fe-S)-binding protein, partial [Candidatus Hodarchaeota archaeon]
MQGIKGLEGYDVERQKRKALLVLRRMMEPCESCGQCLQNCKFYTYSQDEAKEIMRGIKEFVFSKGLSGKPSKKARRFVWSCGLCEHCNLLCPLPPDKQISRSAWIIILRSVLLKKDMAPFTARVLRLLLKDCTNPILKNIWPIDAKLSVPDWHGTGDPMLPRIRLAIEKARQRPTKGAEVCFFGGCGHVYGSPDVVYQTISILEDAGVDMVTIGNPDFCCGVVYVVMGLYDMWIDQTARLAREYLDLRPRPSKILLQCPGCTTVHMFDMSRYGVDLPLDHLRKMVGGIEIVHVVEYISDLIKEGRLQLERPINMTVTYNDNCSIGRRLKISGRSVYDKPRHVLRSIPELNLVESDYTRDNAFCCGGLASKSKKIHEVHEKIFKSMVEKGSDTLLSPCMGCVASFRGGAKTFYNKTGHKIKILDILRLVHESLGKRTPRRHDPAKGSPLKKISRLMKDGIYKDIYRL